MTITGSTISGNLTNAYGGGVATSTGSLTVTGSTISGNAATGGSGGGSGYGGGLYIATGAVTTLKNTRVAGNTASTAGNDIYRTDTTG